MGERVRIDVSVAADPRPMRWRQCSRCWRCFWLADDEAVPSHATSDDARLGRTCGPVAAGGASE